MRHQGPNGATTFRTTGESDADGIAAYAEVGRSWTRRHRNGAIAHVLATPLGNFVGWAAPAGTFKSARAYSNVPKAKAAADAQAACVSCRCESWEF